MKYFILILMTTYLSMNVFAEEVVPPPIQPPVGMFSHKGELYPKEMYRAKTFLHNTPEGQREIQDLKNQGYTCVRKSISKTHCWLKKNINELPNGTSEKTVARLKGYSIYFPDEFTVEFYHNGSTTKEWLVHGPFKIGGTALNVYRITRDYEGEVSFSFPVSEENPIGVLFVRGENKFGYPLLMSHEDENGYTNSWYFEALYTPL